MLGQLVLIDCDYFKGGQSSRRGALLGGRCNYGVDCGFSYLDASDTFAVQTWVVGACIVIRQLLILMNIFAIWMLGESRGMVVMSGVVYTLCN